MSTWSGQLSIAQQRAKGAGTVTAGPSKTRRSRRLLPLDAAPVDGLRRHKKEQDVERGPGARPARTPR